MGPICSVLPSLLQDAARYAQSENQTRHILCGLKRNLKVLMAYATKYWRSSSHPNDQFVVYKSQCEALQVQNTKRF